MRNDILGDFGLALQRIFTFAFTVNYRDLVGVARKTCTLVFE